MKSLMAIGQYEVAFDPMGLSAEEKEIRSKQLLDSLHMIETFYEEIGGIVGYQFTLLQFLHQPKQRFLVDKSRCHAPSG